MTMESVARAGSKEGGHRWEEVTEGREPVDALARADPRAVEAMRCTALVGRMPCDDESAEAREAEHDVAIARENLGDLRNNVRQCEAGLPPVCLPEARGPVGRTVRIPCTILFRARSGTGPCLCATPMEPHGWHLYRHDPQGRPSEADKDGGGGSDASDQPDPGTEPSAWPTRRTWSWTEDQMATWLVVYKRSCPPSVWLPAVTRRTAADVGDLTRFNENEWDIELRCDDMWCYAVAERLSSRWIDAQHSLPLSAYDCLVETADARLALSRMEHVAAASFSSMDHGECREVAEHVGSLRTWIGAMQALEHNEEFRRAQLIPFYLQLLSLATRGLVVCGRDDRDDETANADGGSAGDNDAIITSTDRQ